MQEAHRGGWDRGGGRRPRDAHGERREHEGAHDVQATDASATDAGSGAAPHPSARCHGRRLDSAFVLAGARYPPRSGSVGCSYALAHAARRRHPPRRGVRPGQASPLRRRGGGARRAPRALQRASMDVDLTTDARPDATLRLVRQGRWADAVWEQGVRFGTVGVLSGGVHLEITTYRADDYQPDSRKPEVQFGERSSATCAGGTSRSTPWRCGSAVPAHVAPAPPAAASSSTRSAGWPTSPRAGCAPRRAPSVLVRRRPAAHASRRALHVAAGA